MFFLQTPHPQPLVVPHTGVNRRVESDQGQQAALAATANLR
jgi:hypothetical protein